MPWFEDYNEEKSEILPLPEGFMVRPAVVTDIEPIARIREEREEREYEGLLVDVKKLFDEYRDVETTHVFTAEGDGAVVGFSIMRYFIPGDDAPVNTAPEGWYLLGINVLKKYRRRGIGTELIMARLRAIPNEFKKAYFFTNTKNFTSQAFHAKVGFTEIKEDIIFPNRKPTTIYYEIDMDELRARDFKPLVP